jgi:hypothetical protein
MTRHPAPIPITPEVWARLTRPPAPRVRGVVIDGRPHIVITTTPRRTA